MRPLRSLLIATAVALTLHVWMLAGHAQHALPSMQPGHAGAMVVQEQLASTAPGGAAPGGVGMNQTCLAVLTALAVALLLAAWRRAADARPPVPVRLPRRGGKRAPPPRCRSPVELGVSRT
jgi:hypothetical protein